MRPERVIAGAALVLITAVAAPAFRSAEAQTINLKVPLSGFNEVPALLTTGSGEFTATVDQSRTSMSFTLTYSGLLADATQSHIHFGQRGVNGGIMVFFCSNLTPPVGVPRSDPCPLREGTVTGTITADHVIGPLGQGITPTTFSDLISALSSGHTYVNVHSTRWPGGELRGQVQVPAQLK